MIYFSPAHTGWVFGLKKIYADDGTYDKYITTSTGASSFTDIELGSIKNYVQGSVTRRGLIEYTSSVFSGGLVELNTALTRGILDEEIKVVSPPQITTLNLTGSPNPVVQDYGTLISGVAEPDVLSRLRIGSPCKFLIKNASPFIYKILDIKEENPNEFIVNATLYETGKFNLIENDVSIETLPNTFSYQVGQTINGITFESLSAPENLAAETGMTGELFWISGSFTDPNPANRATGYAGYLQGPGGRDMEMTVPAKTGIIFSGLDTVGVYTLSVKALGNAGTDGFEENAYFDSQYSTIPVLLIPQEIGTTPTFINNVEILPNF